jgi:DNA-3-methyladenine glycosylase
MKMRRNTDNIEKLCKGPGNFCKAMGFGMEHNKLTCNGDEIKLYDFQKLNDDVICKSKRIGITKSSGLLLRYYLKGSSFVSGKESC